MTAKYFTTNDIYRRLFKNKRAYRKADKMSWMSYTRRHSGGAVDLSVCEAIRSGVKYHLTGKHWHKQGRTGNSCSLWTRTARYCWSSSSGFWCLSIRDLIQKSRFTHVTIIVYYVNILLSFADNWPSKSVRNIWRTEISFRPYRCKHCRQ